MATTKESIIVDEKRHSSTTIITASQHPGSSSNVADDETFKTMEQSDRRSRLLALVGLTYAFVFGLFCLVFGIVITTHKSFDDEVIGIISVVSDSKHPEAVTELVRFAFTQLNTFAAEAIGFVHSVTQRSTLAATHSQESDSSQSVSERSFSIRFHTNLRLLSSPGSPHISALHPNGTASNILMAFLLILTYASVSLIILDVSLTRESSGELEIVAILGVPFIVLGVCTLLKSSIVLYGYHCTPILTWSPSPLNNTYAATTAGKVVRVEGMCMYNVVDAEDMALPQGANLVPPRKPSSSQPSAWRARSGIRRTIVALWVLVVACGVWGGIIAGIWNNTSLRNVTPGLESWSFFPNSRSNAVTVPLIFTPALNWFVCFVILVVIQGSLTMTLHSCELIVNVLRDEDVWRKATTKEGTECPDVLKSFSSFWPSIVLMVGKTILREWTVPFIPAVYPISANCSFEDWIFGFCLSLQGSLLGNGCTLGSHNSTVRCTSILALPIVMRSVQIWYLAFALLLFSACMTYLAIRKPKGPQPAAYGHIQTLANLIDEWNPSMKMWWGHKSIGDTEKDGERVYHAGTDSSPLPPVKLDMFYS
ncbi:hypothetical protein BC629DRAFT_1590181 [Irpex lacteus]|nr:hypothetical protein BC629DRAFT_1590181 [Irpex lacteus]